MVIVHISSRPGKDNFHREWNVVAALEGLAMMDYICTLYDPGFLLRLIYMA